MDAATITTAALADLDGLGLDRLTMRAVAQRLGVQVGGLYYHVPDKVGLLALMADRLCAEIVESIEPAEDWRAAAAEICRATRRTLLAHRDGARIFAGSPLVASVNALGLERLMGDLAQGLAEDRVATCADTLLSYVTGYVLQEQHDVAPAFTAETVAELRTRFPRVFAGGDSAGPERTFDDALEAVIAGFQA